MCKSPSGADHTSLSTAGNRWHIDCFRCHSCHTLLDSDANLLLLGDGSLICNNCTYSCSACHNKIEDLAILTGDQAFCASCFRCRNCKRKIENLRYARTSQGIFCMSCHESLMARRRKKSKNLAKASLDPNGRVEKALPSLPPGAASLTAFSPDIETPPELTASVSNGKSPGQRHGQGPGRREPSASNRRDVSPMSDDTHKEEVTLPSSTYVKDGRPTNASGSDDGDVSGYIPLGFDSTPISGPPQISRRPIPTDSSPPATTDSKPSPRDYFGAARLPAKSSSTHRDVLREEPRPASSRSASADRGDLARPTPPAQPKNSPHIAYQEKGRQKRRDVSGNNTPGSTTGVASPSVTQDKQERTKTQSATSSPFTHGKNDGFKLQDVPKAKKLHSRQNSRAETSPRIPTEASRDIPQYEATNGDSPASIDSPNPFDDPKRKEGTAPAAVPVPPKHADRPARGDSLAARNRSADPPTPTVNTATAETPHERKVSNNSIPAFVDAQTSLSRDNSRHVPVEQVAQAPSPRTRSSFDAPPPRSSSRPSNQTQPAIVEDFTAPRSAPPPPPPTSADRHRHNDSVSTRYSDLRSDAQPSPSMRSPALPRQSADGFSVEEEMARIMSGDSKREKEDRTSSVIRKVSNAVRHGRSYSDRAAGAVSRTPGNGSVDLNGTPMIISSPIMTASPNNRDVDHLKAQLARALNRITELETDKASLEHRLNGSSEIREVDSELHEKRSTMALLDTQKEMLIRQLESMTEHLEKARNSEQPLDLSEFKSGSMNDYVKSIEKLSDKMSAQINDLMNERNALSNEIRDLVAIKDKAIQEYEEISAKNHQLHGMNQQIVQGMQQMYKENRGPNAAEPTRSASTNGLGIYHPNAKMETPPPEMKQLNMVNTDGSLPNLMQESEAESAAILNAPQVVNIRKAAQPKKFTWRRNGEKIAKNVTKGIKGAFAQSNANERGGPSYGEIGMPYNAMHVGGNVTHVSHLPQASAGSEQGNFGARQGIPQQGAGQAGFGWLAQKNGGLKAGNLGSGGRNGSNSNLIAPSVASADGSGNTKLSPFQRCMENANEGVVLFGSELEARCEFEKRVVPSMVTRCIEEVELRGMDVEGVYRKSGGSGQVKTVQQGFERDGNHDVSDPDLDIHAVTSALKQYFRKLPTPLITYDVYDSLLDAGQLHDSEKQALALRAAVAELPEHHRNCLEFLFQHLVRVASRQDQNLMTTLNLAVVFAPTIMRPRSIEREMSDMQAQREAVQALLQHHITVFAEDD
ncbi:RhoGAP-domain-containing protein [Polychaeton citri CBS 116435]|uniref:RhoGAP-domain-containing protein n=1 Tax=Polychaeton citri CBS 116435 TaxID=1314669 RepID=A0A9P4Q9Z6_9PEZI|nr:RhoGAP-domain-containing protein [Polychaeton citri CBS 116435]